MVALSADQIFTSTFQLAGAEQVQAANSKVVGSLTTVGSKWNALKNNVEQGRAALSYIGGQQGLLAGAGFLLGSQALGDPAGSTFAGQIAVLAGQLGIYGGTYKLLGNYVDRTQRIFRVRDFIYKRSIHKINKDLEGVASKTNSRYTKFISSADMRIKRIGARMALLASSTSRVLHGVGPMVASIVLASLGGQIIGNIVDNMSNKSSAAIGNFVKATGDRLDRGFKSLIVAGEVIALANSKLIPFYNEEIESFITMGQPRVTQENDIRRNIGRAVDFIRERQQRAEDTRGFVFEAQVKREIESIKNKLNEFTEQYSIEIETIINAQQRMWRK